MSRCFISIISIGLLIFGLSTTVYAETVISNENANILGDVTWTIAGSPYVLLQDVEVRADATLTIEPGVEIRFSGTDPNASGESPDGVEFIISGQLIAEGTIGDPIRLHGQNLAGAADFATGVRFASGAQNSTLKHVNIVGLAHGIDVRGTLSLTIEDVFVEVTKTALHREANNDLRLVRTDLNGGDFAADLVALGEERFFQYQSGEVTGDIVFRGSQLFNSEILLSNVDMDGSLKVEGDLQAGASISLEDSALVNAQVYVGGSVQTGAKINIVRSSVDAIPNKRSINVEGSVLADAQITISDSELDGHVNVGPPATLNGAFEGQYLLMDELATWDEASTSCQSMGARLADSRSAEESELLYYLARQSSDGVVWIGGSLTTPPCGEGDTFVDVGTQDDCNQWNDLGYSVQTNSFGQNCACNLQCGTGTQTNSNSCFPINFACTFTEQTSYEARIPNCDAANAEEDFCYGDHVSWNWEGEASFSQDVAIWAMGEADRLACLSGTHRLLDPLHIAVDAVDPTGSENGRMGLWRARNADSRYAYICEGQLGVVSAQDPSRGAFSVTNSNIDGDMTLHLGTFNAVNSAVQGLQTYTLSRGATMSESQFTGAVAITSLDRVDLSRNVFESTELVGGGVSVEAEFTYAYANTIDGGAYGIAARGPALLENNVITRSEIAGVILSPEAGPNPSEDTVMISNTLVGNHHGVIVSGTVNAPQTVIANNIVYRGDGIGMTLDGFSSISLSHNDVFGYVTSYDGMVPDASSLNVNPLLVADFPTNPPILRIDSGSPLIDQGNCELVPPLDFDGAPRPFDGDFDSVLGCDIGAYEFGPEFVTILVNGQPADINSFATGKQVTLSLQGQRGSFVFEVNPATWEFSEGIGIFHEETGRFRPAATPDFYADGIRARFGGLTDSIDVELSCGCVAPDQVDQGPGECNDVPQCYFSDWDCPVESYCEPAEVGSFEDPFQVAAGQTKQIRAGARDSFGFVFRVNGGFTYEVINGGGTVDTFGRFTADESVADYLGTLRISWNGLSGLSDVSVIPDTADLIEITRASATVGTRRALQYNALVKDVYGNSIPEAAVVWSVDPNVDASIDAQTGVLTAGCTAGTFFDAVTATYQGVTFSADLIVEEGGAPLSEITILPPSVEISATTTTIFEATVTDTCNFTRPAPNPVFTSRASAGEINVQNGLFLASCTLGDYADGVTVASSGLQATAQVTVIDAPLERIRIQPENAQIRATSTGIFEVLGEDSCGRIQQVEPIWSTPITNGITSVVGVNSNAQLALDCSPIGIYETGIIANFGNFSDSARVEVISGDVDSLNVPQQNISVPAGNSYRVAAVVEDRCGNSRNDALRWSATTGSIDEEGNFTAGCERDQFNDAIIVRAGIYETPVDVNVIDGVLSSIVIEPDQVTIQADAQRQLRANLYDGCFNLIEGETTWSLAQGGSITPAGILSAGTQARTYVGAVIAEVEGFQDQADLVITPAVAETLTINPDPLQVEAGDEVQLEVIARDRFGNTFVADAQWTVTPEAGEVDDQNVFTAATLVNDFDDGLTARVGDVTESVNVELVAGPIDRLNVQPSPVIIAAGETLTMTATPVDQYGNSVDAPIVWSVEGEGGLITEGGVFTADTVSGVYEQSLYARSGDVESAVTIRVTPNDPSELLVIPEQIILTPTQQLQLTVQTLDRYGNEIQTTATYSIENGGASITPNGLITAHQATGIFQDSLLIRSGNLERQLTIQVIPGAPVNIQIEPNRVEIQPNQSQVLVATFVDAFDNPVDVEHVWSGLGQSGEVTPNGSFSSYATAGVYPQALVVRGGGLEAFVDVEVIPGPVVSIHIEPELIIATPGSTVPLNVYFKDAQGNRTSSDESISWGVLPNSLFSITADGILSVDCSGSPGFYLSEVSATAGNQGVFQARADLEVRPGETTFIEIVPNRVEIQVTESTTLTAEGKDSCGYDTLAVAQWSVIDGRGSINPEGRFTADTLAEEVTVRARFEEITADAMVVVNPGAPTQLTLSPNEVSLTVDTRVTFVAEAVDAYDNRWTPDNVTWAVANNEGAFEDDSGPNQEGPIGSISEQGELRAGETSGRFLRGVRASFENRNAISDIYLTPAEPSVVDLSPDTLDLIPMQRYEFSASVSDQFGNLIQGVEPVFTCSPEVGTCSEAGVLTATDRIGSYLGAVEARVGTAFDRSDVNVNNSDVARIEIEPASLVTTVGSLDNFTATVYDTEGVVIADATVTWSVEDANLGSITPTPEGDARLAIGSNPNRYFSGVKAQIGEIIGTADVIVPTDFDEDGIEDVLEIAQDVNLDPRDPADAAEDYDEDGLSNGAEVNESLSIRDGDSDDDGISDGEEEGWDTDADNDGLINALDSDSDNDGILDGTELGRTQPHRDTDGSEHFRPDLDPDTTTDMLDPDSDGDGENDGEEDKNQNGRLDPGETSPNRSVPYVYCDPTAEDTGCSVDQVCVNNACQDPEPVTNKDPDSGCASVLGQSGSTLIFFMLAALMLVRRRELE